MISGIIVLISFLTALPMPKGRVTKYGCTVDLVDNSVKVDAKHVNDPPRSWATTVWAEILNAAKWTAELPAKRVERAKALKDCDQWMRAVEKRLQTAKRN